MTSPSVLLLRRMLGSLVIIGLGLFMMLTLDDGSGTVQGLPTRLVPWIVMACGVGLLLVSLRDRAR